MEVVQQPDSAISLDTISSLLKLTGSSLLEQTSLVLHNHFQSFCTCIVEVDRDTNLASTLAYIADGQVQESVHYGIDNTPCEQTLKTESSYCFYATNAFNKFPNDTFLVEFHLETYLGIPLKNQNNETLGVLISTFKSPPKQTEKLIDLHQMLANVIIHELRSKWLTAQTHSLLEQLSFQAEHDTLTGLFNRTSLSIYLQHYINNAHSQPFTLIFADLDKFKEINNVYGSLVGDQVICYTADKILDHLLPSDLAFRIGGDEFAILTRHPNPEQLFHEISQDIQQGFQDPNRHINLAISAGMVEYNTGQDNPDMLILQADIALKHCKQDSQVTFQVYDDQLDKIYHRNVLVAEYLRNELKDPTGIQVYLQPIVRMNEKRWQQFEVLTRWNHDILGFVSPVEFIAAAEEHNLVIELGELIVELAFQAKKKMEEKLGYIINLNVNCSAYELNDPESYQSQLLEKIYRYGFDPSEFIIEITESTLLSDNQDIQGSLSELRHLGFKIALDDFGTGYSSLNYIHKYEIDCIKIDSTFVQNMLSNKTSERIIVLVIKLAQQLGVSLVAEGVETEEELIKLSELGCHKMQGYYFCRPQPADQLIKIISQQ